MDVSTIFATLGIIALLKGFMILVFSKPIRNFTLKLIKKESNFRNLAILEVAIGIILIALAVWVF
jgi:hypothetical protein